MTGAPMVYCVVDGAAGVYAWQWLVEQFPIAGVGAPELAALKAGPGHPDYWDAATALESSGRLVPQDGAGPLLIWQGESGDIFAGDQTAFNHYWGETE